MLHGYSLYFYKRPVEIFKATLLYEHNIDAIFTILMLTYYVFPLVSPRFLFLQRLITQYFFKPTNNDI